MSYNIQDFKHTLIQIPCKLPQDSELIRITITFLNQLVHIRNLSSHTFHAYKRDVSYFFDYYANRLGHGITIKELDSLSRHDCRSWLALRLQKGFTASSNARALSAVKTFAKYLKKKNYGDFSAILSLSPPKVPRLLPRPLGREDVQSLLSALENKVSKNTDYGSNNNSHKFYNSWQDLRDFAMITLLYATGMRISEALSLPKSSAHFKEVVITGKGQKQRKIPLLPIVKERLIAYLNLCPYKKMDSEPLFISARGNPLLPRQVQRLMQSWRKKLGFDKSTTPHALRHSFASHLLDGGGEIRTIQSLLGHASLSTTQNYTSIEQNRILDKYLKLHPRANIKPDIDSERHLN